MGHDEVLEAARLALEEARALLEDGRDGASLEWLAAAEQNVRAMEEQYRWASASAWGDGPSDPPAAVHADKDAVRRTQ